MLTLPFTLKENSIRSFVIYYRPPFKTRIRSTRKFPAEKILKLAIMTLCINVARLAIILEAKRNRLTNGDAELGERIYHARRT